LTHCTGKRSGSSPLYSAVSTASKCASRAGPSYHGVRALRLATLSPSRADSGIATIEPKPSDFENAANAAAMS
jgi:hypothetical protein